MALYEEISSNFEFLGIRTTEKVITKCAEICKKYQVTAEELVDQWCAYTASNLNGAEPSVEALETMERKEYSKHKNMPTKNASYYTLPEDYNPTEEISVAHTTKLNIGETPKRNKSIKRLRSPDTTGSPSRTNITYSQGGFSPISYSPSVSSHSTNYAERKTRGAVLKSYGSDDLLKVASFKRKSSVSLTIGFWDEQSSWTATETQYMYEISSKKAFSLNNVTNCLGQALRSKHGLDQINSFTKHTSGMVTTYGRICSDCDGKINYASVLLEETKELSNGQTIVLNLTKLSSYAIFPGQVAAVQGNLVYGKGLVVNNLFTDVTLPLPDWPKTLQNLQEPLQIVVAAGPFTVNNDLLYQPLEDLVKYILQQTPHVLILVGPFVDSSHDNVCDGSMAETYDTFFEHLVEKVMNPLKDLDIQVILVSSSKDAHHHNVYPTPPYEFKKKYTNLHCFPDPAVININGVAIGVTSADVLFHLSSTEAVLPLQGDRFRRLVGHLLTQQSFYPLYPPNSSMCVDEELLQQYGILPVTPHILILPSNFTHFVKDVNGCVTINPERLAKGLVAGTFARLEIYPGTNATLCDNIACQIIRI